MKRITLFCIFVFSIPAICSAQSDNSDYLTITTYYPSPYGVYGTLKLHPRNTPPGQCREGELYYHRTAPIGLHVCNETLQWQSIGGGSGGGYWTLADNNLTVSDNTWRVGIGTTAPAEKLYVNGNITATGDVCNGAGVCLSAASASASRCVIATCTSSTITMHRITCTATCPAGYYVTGGGFLNSATSGPTYFGFFNEIIESYPSSNTTWTVKTHADYDSAPVTGYARCCP